MSSRLVWGLFMATLLLVGCGEDHLATVREYVDKIKSETKGYVDPLPDIKQVETFLYQPGGRREPFDLPAQLSEVVEEAASNSGIAPDPLRRKEELEKHPLDSLRMVGTINQADVMWALVLTQEGDLFRVRAGNYAGQNHGQITRVTDSRMELTEIVPDGADGWQERQSAVALTVKE